MNYLNRRDSDRIMMIAGMISSLEEWISDIEGAGKRCTGLKYAKTYLYKYMDRVMAGLPRDEVERIIDQAARREVGFYVKG